MQAKNTRSSFFRISRGTLALPFRAFYPTVPFPIHMILICSIHSTKRSPRNADAFHASGVMGTERLCADKSISSKRVLVSTSTSRDPRESLDGLCAMSAVMNTISCLKSDGPLACFVCYINQVNARRSSVFTTLSLLSVVLFQSLFTFSSSICILIVYSS